MKESIKKAMDSDCILSITMGKSNDRPNKIQIVKSVFTKETERTCPMSDLLNKLEAEGIETKIKRKFIK